jgi:endonuclease/exonuclease/phosphatase (EEP) superfamily protein YafD
MTVVSVASFNFGARGRIPDADIPGCQEAGDKARVIRVWRAARPGDKYDGNGRRGRGRTPILYATAVVKRTGGSTPRILERTHAPIGAGGPYIGPKYATTARFRVRATGSVFTVVNVHGVPSLWNPKRRRMHREQMRRLTAHVRTITGPCIVVGDFNCRWSHKHLNGLRALGFTLDNPKGGTHGRRQIDLVMSRGMSKTAARLVSTGSDHRAVVVTYRT